MQDILTRVLKLSSTIRYVAIYRNGKLASASRADLSNASSNESDKYEELLVNPTLLTLVRQRGNIDCGGLEYVLIRYGNFFEYVAPINAGHVSVGLEPTADPLTMVPRIAEALASFGSGQSAV